MKKKLLIALVPVLFLGLYLGLKLFRTEDNFQKIKNPVTQRSSPSPTPFPFQELTIPYLQKQTFNSNLAELEEISEAGTYTSYLTSYQSDGLKINGLLTQPKGNPPDGGWPGIVFIHGYIPPDDYRTTEKYNDYVDYLARNGLVVFKIDLRGHGDSEGKPCGAYYSSDYVIDTLNAYSALQNADFVDETKVGLWGHSMAGNLVLRSLVSKPDIPAAVVWAGTVFTYDDFQEYGIDDQSYEPPPEDSPRRQRFQELIDTYGRYDSESEFWQEVTSVNYLADINGAVQFHHAANDSVVSIDYSRNIDKLLQQAGVSSRLFEYSNGGHNLASPAFSTAMSRTVNFYKTHLSK